MVAGSVLPDNRDGGAGQRLVEMIEDSHSSWKTGNHSI
jgi:hypothetical protein